MGGMVAEELFFGETTSGAAGDLQAATTAAAQMVGRMGMAGTLFSCEAVSAIPANLVAKVLSTDDWSRAVLKPFSRMRGPKCGPCLNVTATSSSALRDALLERDELIGDEILDVIRSATASGVNLGLM